MHIPTNRTTELRASAAAHATPRRRPGTHLVSAARSLIVVPVLAAVLVAATSACSRGDSRQQGSDTDGGDGDGDAVAATPGFTRQAVPYTARPLEAFGRLTGVVEIDGAPPADSVVQPTLDQTVCGTSFTRRGVARQGTRAAGVVVWLDGIRSGKPLPIERRFEITNERCALVPELQPAIAGGTLNVRSVDPVLHRTRIVRRDGGQVLASIRETDEGQVVPNEHVLQSPGLLELTCDVHSWTRGWIAVFDHPYFTMSAADGSFVIDSVPPGRYRLYGWHPRLGAIDDSVTIEQGRDASVVVRAAAGGSE